MPSDSNGLRLEEYSELWRADALDRGPVQRAIPAQPGDAGNSAPATRPGVMAPGEEQAPARFFGGEAFELVRNLFLAPNGNPPRAVVFCAVEPGCECGWIAAQAAELLAGQGIGSVCVVDADVSRPSLNTYFGMENRPGLGEALGGAVGAKDFAKAVEPGGLWVVTAGTNPTRVDPKRPEYRQRLEGRVAQLRATFDYLIVHAPPAHSSPISSYLAPMAAGTVLVLEPSVTRQQSARKAKEQIEAAGGRVLGVVLHRPAPPARQTES